MDGKEIVPCIYEQAWIDFVEDANYLYVHVKDNDKWGIRSMDEKEIVPCIYELASIDFEEDTKSLSVGVKNNGKCGIRSMDGKEIVPCAYDQAYITSTLLGGEVPYITIINDDKWGLCNIDGKVMVPCRYDQARLEYIEEANFYYADVMNNGKYGICTLDGKEIVPCRYKYVEVMRDETTGLLYIRKNLNGKIGISNISGDEIIPCEYGYVGMSYDDETKANYYYAINSDDNTYRRRNFNLSGELISEWTRKINKTKPDVAASKPNSNSDKLSRLEKTAAVLQILSQGLQSIGGYMNTYSSRNIYSPQNYGSYSGSQSSSYSNRKQTCSFCHGTGYNPGMERPPFYSYSEDPMTGSCDICGDKSNHYHNPCPSCGGRGYR